MGSNRGGGERPCAAHMQLNKRIMGARDADNILAIVEAEHGEFNAVNAATACSRLAKAPQSCENGLSVDERRVRLLLETVTRLAPSMNAQALANTVWALAKLGWQAGEGAMRCALEGAAVRIFRQTGSVCDRAFPRSNRDAGDWK